MAYSVVTGSIVQFVVNMRLNGQRCMTVRNYVFGGSPSITDGRAVLDQILTEEAGSIFSLYGQMKNVMTSDVTFESLQAQWIYPERFAYRRTVLTDAVGVATPPTLPQNIAGVVTVQSDHGDRGSVGDVHFPGLPLADATAGNFNDGGIADLTNLGESLTAPLTCTIGGSIWAFLPIIYHRATPAASALITGYSPQVTVRTMRRRTVGRGI